MSKITDLFNSVATNGYFYPRSILSNYYDDTRNRFSYNRHYDLAQENLLPLNVALTMDRSSIRDVTYANFYNCIVHYRINKVTDRVTTLKNGIIQSFCRTQFGEISKILLKDDDYFYGTNYALFDKNMKCLIMIYGRIDTTNKIMSEVVIRVDNSIYTDISDPLAKAILTDIIPSVISAFESVNRPVRVESAKNIEVFDTVSRPSVNIDNNKAINEYMSNIDIDRIISINGI